MLLHIRAVLSPETRQTVQEMLAGAVYVDGRRSAGREAGQVKHNQELAADDPLRARLDRLVIGNPDDSTVRMGALAGLEQRADVLAQVDKLRADTPKAIAEDDEWRRRNEIDAWRKTPVGKEKRNAARRKKRTESNAEIAALSDEERKERKRAQKCEHMRRKRAEAAELKSKSG